MKKLAWVAICGLLGGCVTAQEAQRIDDDFCASTGLRYGTPDYAACRMMRQNARDVASENRRAAMLITGLSLMNRR